MQLEVPFLQVLKLHNFRILQEFRVFSCPDSSHFTVAAAGVPARIVLRVVSMKHSRLEVKTLRLKSPPSGHRRKGPCMVIVAVILNDLDRWLILCWSCMRKGKTNSGT
jgi:hypothetical protein